MNGRVKVSLILALALVVGRSFASPDPTSILRDSYAAEDKLQYTGTLTTRILCQAGLSPSAEVRISRSGRMSRMDYVSGPSVGTSIVDDGKSITRLVAASKTAYVSETPDAPEQLDLLLSNYSPVLIGSAKIAGRDCYEIKLAPKCACNPYKKLWIDKGTHLALKIERYGTHGELVSSTEYKHVDYAARPAASEFRAPSGWKKISLAGAEGVGLAAVKKVVGFAPVKPGYVPKGYRFDNYYLRTTPRCAPFAGLRYTNGLNTISVFERKGGCFGPGYCCRRGRGRGRGCADCATGEGCCLLINQPQGTMVHRTVGDLTVMIVGDISPTELQKMAASLK